MDQRLQNQILDEASRLVEISRTLPSNKDPQRAGGYVLVGINGLENPIILPIGKFPSADKTAKYGAFVQEKAYRLYADWFRGLVRGEDVVSSWQTRDEAIDRYGGAVLFARKNHPDHVVIESRPHIISFSGLLEDVDEALGLNLGYKLGFANDLHTHRVLAISDNQVFPEMLEAYRKSR